MGEGLSRAPASQRLAQRQERILRLTRERLPAPVGEQAVLPLLEVLKLALDGERSAGAAEAERRFASGQPALERLRSIDVFQSIVLETLEDGEPLAFQERAAVLDSCRALRFAVAEQTQRRERQLEQALVQSEERCLTAARAAGFAIWDWDLGSNELHWSGGVEALLGHPGGALSSMAAWLEHVHPADRERVSGGLRQAIDQGRSGWADEFRFLRRDGRYAGVIARSWIVHDPAGNAARVIGGLADVSEQRALERKLADQVQLTRAVAENAASGLFVLDARGRATYLNPAATAVTGYRLDELRERPLHDVLHPAYPDGRPFRIDECPVHRRGAALKDHQCTLTRKDGTLFPAACSVMPLTGGEAGSAVLELRDITVLKRAEETLFEAMRARDEFLSIASHELRTPLTALQLQIQAMTRGPLQQRVDARLKGRLEAAERAIARMTQLVDELLDVSRVKAGRLELDLRELNLSEVVREVIARLQPDARHSGTELVVTVPDRVDGRWDKSRLDQLVSNLLSNALKYGEGKPVEVHVETDGREVVLRVKDHGIGIAPEAQSRIFERFERAVSERNFGGFGLGLWIVRRIVEAMNGSIRVESEPGNGATFEVRLPVTVR